MVSRYSVARVTAFLVLSLCGGSALANKQNDTLNIAWDQPLETADAYFNSSREGIIAARMIWDQLIERDPDTFEYRPSLATAWRWIDDLTLEFDLRQGVVFHDGQAFDADDVVYTLNFVTNPNSKVLNTTNVGWIKSTERINQYKVRLHLKEPFPTALEYISNAIPMYPRKYYAKVGPAGMARKPVGTGPYMVESLEPGKQVVFVKNTKYWEGSPKGRAKIGRLVARVIPEKSTQIATLLSGEIDLMWYVPLDQVQSLKSVPGLSVTAGETMRVGYLNFDAASRSGTTPLKDMRVRRAIAHSIDRTQFAKSFFGPEARVLAAPCFPTQFGCYQDATRYAYSAEKAKQLMAEAGYPNGFDTELYAYRSRQWTDAIAGYLRAVGVRVKINYLQYPAFRDKNHAGITPISFGDWGSFSINDASAFLDNYFRGTPDDFTGDDVLRELVKKGDSTNDTVKRLSAYKQAIARIMDQMYMLPLNSYSIFYAYPSDLEFKSYKDEIPRYYLYSWK